MPMRETSQELYLGLLKRCLTDSLYEERPEYVPIAPRSLRGKLLYRLLMRYLRRRGIEQLFRAQRWDIAARIEGSDWPHAGETMIGFARLDNIRDCVRQVLRDGIPGDLAEAGVWRGGAAIFMKAVLAVHGDSQRKVWVVDSFEGLPRPDPAYPADEGDIHHEFKELAVPLDEVKRNFARYGLLDDRVIFLRGWFRETLPHAPIEQLALLRLDADMYESTSTVLSSLYSKLSPGGFTIVDDYYSHPACRAAVDDFRNAEGITEEIKAVDRCACFWRKKSTS
jgi:O-methyltransferase